MALVAALAIGCTKVPSDPDDPANPVWNPGDLNAPAELALKEPSIYFSPSIDTVTKGRSFSLEIRAIHLAESPADLVKGIHLVIRLPRSLTYSRYDTLGFLAQQGGTVLHWGSILDTTLTIDLVRVGNPATTPADSGGVARVWLQANQSGEAYIRLDESLTEVRNGANRSLNYVKTRNAIVRVR